MGDGGGGASVNAALAPGVAELQMLSAGGGDEDLGLAQNGGGATGAAGEAENPFDPLHSVFAELAKNVKLDKAALREIKAHAASLKKSVLGISATQKRLTGIDDDLKALRENRIPNQLKPFSPGLEVPH